MITQSYLFAQISVNNAALASLSTVDYAIIVAYLLGMIALGAMVSTRIRGFKDYFLAGGTLTTPLLICTLVSSYYGLEVTFGTSETSFYYGIVAWCWYSLPYYVFIAIAALVIAPRLRVYRGAMTLSDILQVHYGTPTRVLGAVASFIYSAPIVAMAGMMTIMSFLGLPVVWGMVVTIGVCALYTIMGGLWADAITDTIQFVLMCVSLAIAIPFAIDWVGGWQFLDTLPRDVTGTATFMAHHGGLSHWTLVAWAITGLTVLIEPAFYQRVFAAEDDRAVRRALLVGILLWASYDWGVTLIGLIGRAAVESNLLPSDLTGREVMLSVAVPMLPIGLRGLFLGGILAAAMSNIDSYSLLASGNIVYDIYRPIFDPRASDRRLLWQTRIGVFVVMGLALVISLFFTRLRDTWQFMASVMTSVVFVPVMGALFSRPRPAAGLGASAFGFVGLIAFYATLFWRGSLDPDQEQFVWRIAGIEIWQDYATLCALPISFAGFMMGNRLGRPTP